jgi:hypothetical protein
VTSAPTTQDTIAAGSGRLFGLLEDPAEVVGAAVDDWDDDARHLIGVLSRYAVEDLR